MTLKICRVCFDEGDDLYNLGTGSDSYGHKLASCVPEIDVYIVRDPSICKTCLSRVEVAYGLRETCIENEKRFNDHFDPNDFVVTKKSAARVAVNSQSKEAVQSKDGTANGNDDDNVADTDTMYIVCVMDDEQHGVSSMEDKLDGDDDGVQEYEDTVCVINNEHHVVCSDVDGVREIEGEVSVIYDKHQDYSSIEDEHDNDDCVQEVEDRVSVTDKELQLFSLAGDKHEDDVSIQEKQLNTSIIDQQYDSNMLQCEQDNQCYSSVQNKNEDDDCAQVDEDIVSVIDNKLHLLSLVRDKHEDDVSIQEEHLNTSIIDQQYDSSIVQCEQDNQGHSSVENKHDNDDYVPEDEDKVSVTENDLNVFNSAGDKHEDDGSLQEKHLNTQQYNSSTLQCEQDNQDHSSVENEHDDDNCVQEDEDEISATENELHVSNPADQHEDGSLQEKRLNTSIKDQRYDSNTLQCEQDNQDIGSVEDKHDHDDCVQEDDRISVTDDGLPLFGSAGDIREDDVTLQQKHLNTSVIDQQYDNHMLQCEQSNESTVNIHHVESHFKDEHTNDTLKETRPVADQTVDNGNVSIVFNDYFSEFDDTLSPAEPTNQDEIGSPIRNFNSTLTNCSTVPDKIDSGSVSTNTTKLSGATGIPNSGGRINDGSKLERSAVKLDLFAFDETSYFCALCNASNYSTASALNTHINEVHRKIERTLCELMCSKCDKNFETLKGIRTHLSYCYNIRRKSTNVEVSRSLSDKVSEKWATINSGANFTYDKPAKVNLRSSTRRKSMDCARRKLAPYATRKSTYCERTRADLFGDSDFVQSLNILTDEKRSRDALKDSHSFRGKTIQSSVKVPIRQPYVPLGRLNVSHCNVCSEYFVVGKSLCAHLMNSHRHRTAVREAAPTVRKKVSCEICKELHDENNIKVHMKIHDVRSTYDCGKCGETFADTCDLEAHGSIHMRNMCEVCFETFATKLDLQMHEKTHVTKCCGTDFSSGSLFQLHTYQEHGKSCGVCKRSFGSLNAIFLHLLKHTGEEKLRCKHCKTAFKNVQLLQAHECGSKSSEQVRTNTKNSQETSPHRRKAEGKKSAAEVRKTLTKYECKECLTVCYSKMSYDKHLQQHRKDGKFSYPSSFCTNLELRAHLDGSENCCQPTATEHNLRSSDELKLEESFTECADCKTNFKTLAAISSHKCKCYVCKHCLVICSSRYWYEQHLQSHEDLKAQLKSCQICDERFATSLLLKQHLLEEHCNKRLAINLTDLRKGDSSLALHLFTDSTQHPLFEDCYRDLDDMKVGFYLKQLRSKPGVQVMCIACDVAFQGVDLYLEHMRRLHSTCTNCNEQLYDVRTIIRHIYQHRSGNGVMLLPVNNSAIHTATVKRCFETELAVSMVKLYCHLCSREYSSKGQLARHMKKEHEWFKCNRCDEVFTEQAGYETHMKTHNTCDVCEKSFVMTANLKRHKILYHSTNWPSYSYKIYGRIKKCNFCDEQFRTVVMLKRHVASEHGCCTIESAKHNSDDDTREKELANAVDPTDRHWCAMCKMAFETSQILRAHIRTHI